MAKKITLKNKAGEVLCPHTAIEQVQGLKEALDGKLPLTGGVLTGDIIAPSFKTNLTSVVAEAVMAYPVNISWNNDLNSDTYLKAGMYRTSSATSTVNQPNEKGHSNLLTVRGNESDNIAQMFFDYWNNGKVFTRVGSITVDTTSTSHIFNRDWKQLRTIDDKVTTSHIADTAITPAKIQTSIALNGTPSMTVEPTTSSPDKTIASVGLVKEVVDGIEVGGTNLMVNSNTPISSTAYFIGNLSLYENLIENSVYTITIWGELGADRTSFYLYPEWGMGGALCELQQVSNGVYNATFIFHKGDATNSNVVGLYQMPSASTSTSTIERIKIEKGNKSTDWTPSPEDVEAKIEAAKPTIFLQTLQPSATEVKEGDIWIIQ